MNMLVYSSIDTSEFGMNYRIIGIFYLEVIGIQIQHQSQNIMDT